MSTVSINAGTRKTTEELWARLIPGDEPAHRGKRKPPRSVQQELYEVRPRQREGFRVVDGGISALMPSPLQSRGARELLEPLAVDAALIAINWLIMGALLVPMRSLFPHRRVFEFAQGAPLSLLSIAVLHAAFITLIGYTEGLYAKDYDGRTRRRVLAKSVGLATLLLGFARQLQGGPWCGAVLYCGAGLLHFAALTTWRAVDRKERAAVRRKILIIGGGAVGRRVATYFKTHPDDGRTALGILDDERPLGNGVIGRVGELAQIARKGFVEEIILAAPRDPGLTRWILREACRLRLDVEVVPDLFGCDAEPSDGERIDGLPVVCLHAERLPVACLALKRIADFIGSGLALLVLSPLLAAIAVLIKLDSPGPVLYSAKRAGRKGRLFRCHKFRTMVPNADVLKNSLRENNERAGPFFKITGDPRVTRVGHILRRYSLDELPQLLNVMKGEMSLVGPRPHPLDDVAGYELEHLARLDVTPGLTGLWQVTARRDPSFQRGMELDREYIRTWSLGLDFRILMKTVSAVLQGSGE